MSKTKKLSKLNLKYILDAYEQSNNKDKFFNNYFIKLAGISELKEQVIKGLSETEIKKSWKKKLDNFKIIRKKYLIYVNNIIDE